MVASPRSTLDSPRRPCPLTPPRVRSARTAVGTGTRVAPPSWWLRRRPALRHSVGTSRPYPPPDHTVDLAAGRQPPSPVRVAHPMEDEGAPASSAMGGQVHQLRCLRLAGHLVPRCRLDFGFVLGPGSGRLGPRSYTGFGRFRGFRGALDTSAEVFEVVGGVTALPADTTCLGDVALLFPPSHGPGRLADHGGGISDREQSFAHHCDGRTGTPGHLDGGEPVRRLVMNPPSAHPDGCKPGQPVNTEQRPRCRCGPQAIQTS